MHNQVLKRTESSKVGQLGWVIGHGAHDPISGRLPHSIKQSHEHVGKDSADISVVEDVHLDLGYSLPRILPETETSETLRRTEKEINIYFW